MRVLITGGAGFIGSSIAVALAERHPDWRIVAADNLFRRGSELNLPRLKEAGAAFVHADVRERDDLRRVGEIDALIESSAEPSVLAGGEVIVPVNLLGAYNCFEAARAHGAQVIFLSSSRVYPFAAVEGLAYVETDTPLRAGRRPGHDRGLGRGNRRELPACRRTHDVRGIQARCRAAAGRV